MSEEPLRGMPFKEFYDEYYDMLISAGLVEDPFCFMDMDDEVIMKAIAPYVKNPTGMILVSTPRGNGDGFFAKLWRDCQ